MKKKHIITLIILFVFVVSIFGVCYWQRENLKAVFYVIMYTDEEQKQLLKESEERIKSLSKEITNTEISELPDEAVEMLNKGEITEDDAIKIITGDKTLEDIKKEKKNPEKSSSQGAHNSNVANLVAKMYVLRATYTGKLDSLLGQAKAEYASGASKSAISKKYIGIASSLEGQCDAQVEGVLSQVTAELKKTGGDLSLVSELRSAYRNEKSIKKASLLSQYT